jgi:hypothetical protein
MLELGSSKSLDNNKTVHNIHTYGKAKQKQ